MPRIPRLDAPNSIHHVMNRGARKVQVFIDNDARIRFLHLLSQLPQRFGVGVLGYAILPNHFHLLLRAGPLGLGPAMQYVQGQFSRWLNRRDSWDGPVWKSRFRSRLVEDDRYLAHVLAYIHLNPVEARQAVHVDRAEWTSHAFYVGGRELADWIDTQTLLDVFGSVDAYRTYVAEVRAGSRLGPPEFHPEQLWVTPRKTLPPPASVPRRPASEPLDTAWSVLEQMCGLTRDQIQARPRSARARDAWWLALWWLPRATGMRPAQVATALGIHRSACTRAERRLQELSATNRWLLDAWRRLDERGVGG